MSFPVPTAGFSLPRMYGNPRRGGVDMLYARMASEAPRIPFDEFLRRFDWQQGEHVALIGPTGRGKTSLLLRLLPLRRFVAVTATKPRDATMEHLVSTGYDLYPNWQRIPPNKSPRRVIWPDATSIDSVENQQRVFRNMFHEVYREGGWALAVDEGFVMSETLGLKREMRQIWTQGRSIGISFIVGTQRPRWVPMEMYDQSTHLFFWQNSDARMLDVIGDINGRDSLLVKEIVANLDNYQVLYVNTRTGHMMRTTPPPPGFDTTANGTLYVSSERTDRSRMIGR